VYCAAAHISQPALKKKGETRKREKEKGQSRKEGKEIRGESAAEIKEKTPSLQSWERRQSQNTSK